MNYEFDVVQGADRQGKNRQKGKMQKNKLIPTEYSIYHLESGDFRDRCSHKRRQKFHHLSTMEYLV